MKKIKKDIEPKTSKAAKTAGLRRIQRRHIAKPGEVTLTDCKVRVTLEIDADISNTSKATLQIKVPVRIKYKSIRHYAHPYNANNTKNSLTTKNS